MMTFIYIIAGFVFLFFSLQYLMVFQAKRSKGIKISGLQGRLKALERNGSKGLVYFFSPGCRACKYQTPIIKELQSSNKNIFDVDISKDLQTARVFGIKATPTTVLVENGVVKQVLLGVKQKEDLKSYLRN
jgi:thioredoxin 1